MKETVDADISGLALRFEGLAPGLAEALRREWPAYVRAPGDAAPSLTIAVEEDDRAMKPGRFMEGTLHVESTSAAVVVRRDEGRLEHEAAGARASVTLAQGDAGRRFWGLINLTCAAVSWHLQGSGGGVAHAAGIVLRDRAFLLVGPSGCGKTTWARAASDAGVPVLSDDCVVLATEGGRLMALGSPFRSKELASPGPGRWPVGAILLPQWADAPSLAPASRLMAEARIAANLLYATAAAPAAAVIADGAPSHVLAFRPDAGWIGLLEALG